MWLKLIEKTRHYKDGISTYYEYLFHFFTYFQRKRRNIIKHDEMLSLNVVVWLSCRFKVEFLFQFQFKLSSDSL